MNSSSSNIFDKMETELMSEGNSEQCIPTPPRKRKREAVEEGGSPAPKQPVLSQGIIDAIEANMRQKEMIEAATENSSVESDADTTGSSKGELSTNFSKIKTSFQEFMTTGNSVVESDVNTTKDLNESVSSDNLSELLDKEDDDDEDIVGDNWLEKGINDAAEAISSDSDSDDYVTDQEEMQNLKNSPNQDQLENHEEVHEEFHEEPLNQELLDTSFSSIDDDDSQDTDGEKPNDEPQTMLSPRADPGIRYHDDNIALPGKYYVTTKNGTTLPCEVFAARQYPYDRTVTQFYVHCIGLDRRMDQWVDMDKVDASRQVSSKDLLKLKEENQQAEERMIRTRNRKIRIGAESEEMDEITRLAEVEHEKRTRIKYVNQIVLGQYTIDTWYYSPYPGFYGTRECLFMCEYCLVYFSRPDALLQHKCGMRQPEGREIYRRGNISVYELDGLFHKVYCTNLTLLGKLFIDHKTAIYDIGNFQFYVLTIVDKEGAHIAGFFSKEKFSKNNLACICVLPCYLFKGYGRFLISFSYEFAKVQGQIGSPEKPLSDLGRAAYVKYWKDTLLKCLNEKPDSTIEELSSQTCITQQDIVDTLKIFNMIKWTRGVNTISFTSNTLEEANVLHPIPLEAKIPCDIECLRWKPYPVTASPSETPYKKAIEKKKGPFVEG